MMRMSHVDGNNLFILRKTKKTLCFLVRSWEDRTDEKKGFKAMERSDI